MGMQEKKNSEIKIEDIPSDAVKLMLDYIYGGVLPSNTFMLKLDDVNIGNNSSQNHQIKNENNNSGQQQQGNVIMNVGDNEQKINLNVSDNVINEKTVIRN